MLTEPARHADLIDSAACHCGGQRYCGRCARGVTRRGAQSRVPVRIPRTLRGDRARRGASCRFAAPRMAAPVAAARRTGGEHQGAVRRSRTSNHLGFAPAGRRCAAAADCTAVAAAARRRRSTDRPHQPERIRVFGCGHQSASPHAGQSGPHRMVTPSRASPEARLRAARCRWPPAPRGPRSVPTPAVRSASRPRCRGWSASRTPPA